MRAAVWHGARDIRVEEVPEPGPPAPGHAVVEVARVGICGSDVSEYRDGPHAIPTERDHPVTGRRAPIILGHEYVGRVVAVGDDVANVRPGDRVCGDASLRCGSCYWCLRGEYNICQYGAAVGLHTDGAFARYLDVPANTLEKVPDGIEDDVAAVVEPLAVGLHAVNMGGIRPGDSVVVVGFGMIGAAAMLMAFAAGAGQVHVVEMNPHRRELALKMGATETFDPRMPRLRWEVVARTEGIGADRVLDCTGRPEMLSTSVELTRRGGRLVVCGLGHEPAQFNTDRLVYFERGVVGALGYRFDHQRVLKILATRDLPVRLLLGDVIGLEQIVPDGFERLLNDPKAPHRILIDPLT